MNKYMLLHVGFEPPSPEIMSQWKAWFEDVADVAVSHGGFRAAREITADGSKDLGMDKESLTGYSIIEAESLDAATEIARKNPFISGIRVYEVMEHSG